MSRQAPRPRRFDQAWWPVVVLAGFGAASVTPLLVLKAIDRRVCRFANQTGDDDD